MIDRMRMGQRHRIIALLAGATSLTGCSIGPDGISHWTQPPHDAQYAESGTYHWNGHHGDPSYAPGGLGFRPHTDTSNIHINSPK